MLPKENNMRDQVLSKPQLLREVLPGFEQRVRELLDHDQCRSIQRIFVVGCGDSHNAALAAELGFERLAWIPSEPMTSLQFARYAVPFLPRQVARNSLILGISVSGEVARTIEAISLARQQGALTVAVTGTPSSRIARGAEKVLNLEIPPFPHAPGVRTYMASLVGLYLLAIHLGEVKALYSEDEAKNLRDELFAAAGIMEATIEAINRPTAQLAQQAKEEDNFVFVGAGPNYGTALFSAAKVIEAAGRHAMGQDTEEWSHLQYFVREAATPTFLISPPGLGHSRAAELVPIMRRVGRRVVVVVEEGDQTIADQADAVLPVKGPMREEFTPLVYSTAAELFAAHLSAALGETYFRGFTSPWGQGHVRTSVILTELP